MMIICLSLLIKLALTKWVYCCNMMTDKKSQNCCTIKKGVLFTSILFVVSMQRCVLIILHNVIDYPGFDSGRLWKWLDNLDVIRHLHPRRKSSIKSCKFQTYSWLDIRLQLVRGIHFCMYNHVDFSCDFPPHTYPGVHYKRLSAGIYPHSSLRL